MGRRESSDRRRRRPSHSSSHDPGFLLQRDGARASQSGQHWCPPDTHNPMMPPPHLTSASQSRPSMAPYRRPTDFPHYEDDVGRYKYSGRRRTPRGPSPAYRDRRHRRQRRPESPSSSDDGGLLDSSADRHMDDSISEPESESDDEAPPQRARRERPYRRTVLSEESDVQGVGLRTPSTSSLEPDDDDMEDRAAPARRRRRDSSRAIEAPPAPPAPRPERRRLSGETIKPRDARPPRRHLRRSDPVIVQEPPISRVPSRSASVRSSSNQRSSILSSLLSGSTGHRRTPEKHNRMHKPKEKPAKIVECVICMSEKSSKKAPKLKCGHRMCHSCLKRNFELSLTDPQLMPPRCCTQDRISIRIVEPLFNTSFKKMWNRKYEEFTTQNRLYCPSKRCGEWIKPSRIRQEGNRKSAQCGHCKTKVCVACNGKWHSSLDCPNDDETQRFLKQAKEEGWQRCHSCKVMVERKQGCNHMTCRCGAQFCMLCGSRWKSCDCEWFNFDEDDDFNGYYAERGNPFLSQGRDDDPSDADLPEPPAHGHVRARAPGEGRHSRRLQEQRDEQLARRLQYGMELDRELSVDDDDDIVDDDHDDYDDSYVVGGSGVGAATGLGISSGHYMDEHYRHSSGRNRARVRVKPSSATGVYDRRSGYRTPPRDIYDRTSHGPEASQARGARGGSMERRLAERLSEGRQQRFSPMPDMVMGYPPQSMNPHMGVVPPVLPPPPMGTYPPTRMPMGMAPAGSPPMMASPQHHPFGGGLPPHGPPPMHHPPPMLMGEYAPVPGGGGGIRRRDSGGSAPRSSSMAGLNAQGSGLSRVFEWRNFVPPGVPDSDGPRTSDERLSRVTWDG